MKRTLLAFLLCAAAAYGQAPIKMALPCETTTQEISPTGKHVAIRCKDHTVHVLEIPSGRTIITLGAADDYRVFAFSSNDKWVGAGTGKGEVGVVDISAHATPKRWHVADTNIEFVKFVSDRALVAAPVGGPGQVWDFSSTPTQKATLDTDFAGVTAAGISPDAKMLVTTGADTVVRFYDTATWKKVHEFRELILEPFAAVFSADGKYAIVGGADGQLTLLDASMGNKAKALPVQPDPIGEIDSIDPDHVAVVYFDADGIKPPHLQLWDLQAGTSRPVAMDEKVTGGRVVNGQIWFATVNAHALELSVGN
jgi:WD40 repeat protein